MRSDGTMVFCVVPVCADGCQQCKQKETKALSLEAFVSSAIGAASFKDCTSGQMQKTKYQLDTPKNKRC